MGTTNEHGKLITAAAKAALLPLGCKQIGRSRSWISDERFWVILIEFQPSGWSKGSYLNVGACWLWRARKDLVFDCGYRIGDFIPYKSPEQFAPLIAGHATRAAHEVVSLRQKFNSLNEIYRHLVTHISGEGSPVYFAAVAAGLVGNIEMARRLFDRIGAWDPQYDWQIRLKSVSANLASKLDRPRDYKEVVTSIIDECRAVNRLPPDPDCLQDATAA